MNIVIALLVNALAFYLGAKLLKGVYIKSFIQAIIVAVVVALLNMTLGFFLKVITFGLLGFWLFSLILDAILIKVADWILGGFKVKNIIWALLLALIVSLFNLLIKQLLA